MRRKIGFLVIYWFMGLSIGTTADGLPSSLWVHQDDLVVEGTDIPAYCEGAYREPKLPLATDGRLIDGQLQPARTAWFIENKATAYSPETFV